MPKIAIDGIDFHSEDLSDEGRVHLAELQSLEKQVQKINQEIEIYQMAKIGFTNLLQTELSVTGKNHNEASSGKVDRNA